MSDTDKEKAVPPSTAQDQPQTPNNETSTMIQSTLDKTNHLTDQGNAERLANTHGDSIMHCTGIGWYWYDGTRWRHDEEAKRVFARAVQVVLEIAGEASNPDDVLAYRKWAIMSESRARLEAMVHLASKIAALSVVPEDLDADPYLLNVENGTIDLRTRELRPHAPEDRITKLAPTRYDPEAPCPQFDSFMAEIFAGDEDTIQYVERSLGCGISGHHREYLFLAHGDGANGKSVLLGATVDVLGDYAQQAQTGMLTARRSEHTCEIARLQGTRFVVTSETGEGNELNETLVKQLTGGDRIAARYMRQNVFEFAPSHAFYMQTNHLPEIMGTDEGIWRRVMLIRFGVTIPPEKRDPHLKAKLLQERSGILNRLVAGFRAFEEHGLKPPQSVEDLHAAYREEMDGIGTFVSEYLVRAERATVLTREVHEAHGEWCREAGEAELSQKKLNALLKKRGFRTGHTRNGTAWQDVRLTPRASRPTIGLAVPVELCVERQLSLN